MIGAVLSMCERHLPVISILNLQSLPQTSTCTKHYEAQIRIRDKDTTRYGYGIKTRHDTDTEIRLNPKKKKKGYGYGYVGDTTVYIIYFIMIRLLLGIKP